MTGRVLRAALTTLLLLGGALIVPGAAHDVQPRALKSGAASTASQRFGWHPAIFDFAWEYGESLTDKPMRGTRPRGVWIDASNGSGRASRHNAGLMLESKYGRVVPGDAGPGDHGTTSVTLQGNAQTFGRWEVRIRPWVIEKGGKDYRIKFELVPEDTAQRLCGARSITVADITPRRPAVRIAAYSPVGNRAWRRTIGSIAIQRVPHAYAVEVAKDHVSWFVDGRTIGTVRSAAAVPGVPLTIRVSLVGHGQDEMNHTYAIMDWLRAFGIKNGSHPTNGPRLTAGNHNLHC
jgi:hypothetical protein